MPKLQGPHSGTGAMMIKSMKERRELQKVKIMHDVLTAITDAGKPVEMGWAIYRHVCVKADTPDAQVRELREAYYAGAQHLWATMLTILEPGVEPTENDLKRMDKISDEMEAYSEEMSLKYRPAEGTG